MRFVPNRPRPRQASLVDYEKTGNEVVNHPLITH